MKTIDLLVQALPAIGGWHEKVTHIGQDYDRELMFYGRGNVRSGIILDQLAVDHRRHGHTGIKITRDQYEAALAAKNDGWIEWGGGKHPPVSINTVVDVKLEKGYVQSGYTAGEYSWEHVWQGSNIIAYRLHHPQEAEQPEASEEDLNECIGQAPAPVWNGDGKPTMGTKCEHHSGGQWEVVTIAGIYENLMTGFTDYWMVKEDGSSYTVGNPYRFRPIRSEADKRRDEAKHTIAELCRSASSNGHAADLIYDAIAAGEVLGVKLED